MKTESELILKSRRAVPTILLQSDFAFRQQATADLVAKVRG